MTPSERRVSRRWLLGAVAAVSFAHASPAWAGSYLNRAALLIWECDLELDALRKRLYDPDFARLVHALTRARVGAARDMMVPSEVVQAHPHLMLMLENAERAAGNAVERKQKDFLKFLALARDEQQLFRGIIKQLGWEVPELG